MVPVMKSAAQSFIGGVKISENRYFSNFSTYHEKKLGFGGDYCLEGLFYTPWSEIVLHNPNKSSSGGGGAAQSCQFCSRSNLLFI